MPEQRPAQLSQLYDGHTIFYFLKKCTAVFQIGSVYLGAQTALIKGGIISSRSFYGSRMGHCAPSPNRKKNGMTYGETL